jgi:hypothetical protein
MPRLKGTPKTARRQKGTPNKTIAANQVEVAATDPTPLDHMLAVMRDPRASDERRDLMAKAAAPFIHPRVSPIQASYNQPDGGLDVTRLSDQELEAVIRRELTATSLDASEAAAEVAR